MKHKCNGCYSINTSNPVKISIESNFDLWLRRMYYIVGLILFILLSYSFITEVLI